MERWCGEIPTCCETFRSPLADGMGVAMKAELVPENGDPPIPIVRDVTIVGRREYCDVVIPHNSLSKRHCILVKTDGLLVIRDLATTNGTKVKGQKVRWAALLPDDRISLGGYKLRIYLGPDDMPSPSEQYRARANVAGRTRGPAAPARPATPSTAPWPAVSPSFRPEVPVGFPEPSKSLVTAFPAADLSRPPAAGAAGSPSPLEDSFHFEVLDDDDDEIIELS
jgi:predicted component of type VI protein secretion system